MILVVAQVVCLFNDPGDRGSGHGTERERGGESERGVNEQRENRFRTELHECVYTGP